MTTKGLSERRSLQVIGMSASALRYQPRADCNGTLPERIIDLAQRHRRYGAGMIYLKLRQAGELVNHKRVERLYALERLQVRRRRRKKIPVSERQPLIRPGRPNEVWSADFVFDRIASGRTLKCLGIVDDATHEAVAIIVEHCMGGNYLARVLDGICSLRGGPAVIRTDNGKEFTGKAMLRWAARNGVTLRLIEPGKPNQNAYVESPRRADARRVCKAIDRKSDYNPGKTLNPPATQIGGTSPDGYPAATYRISPSFRGAIAA